MIHIAKSELLLMISMMTCAVAVFATQTEKPHFLTIASLSVFPQKWDKQANAKKIEEMVRVAVQQGAEFVVTPEGALEGYVVNEVINEKDPERKKELTQKFHNLAEPIGGKYIKHFCALAGELKIYFVLGFLEKEGDKFYNTAALIDPGGNIIGKYRKTHFWQGYNVNPPGYTPGNSFPVFNLGFLNVGEMICADRRFPEVARILALKGADLIVCPAFGSWGERNTALMRTRAFENQVFVVFTHPNQSLIIGRDGNIIGQCGKDEIVVEKISLDHLKKNRATVIYRRPAMYDFLQKQVDSF